MPTNTLALWKWELLAISSCIALLAAIIAVLIVYDHHPIFDWHKVTLNTIVSVLATTSKAALLFTIAECIGQWKWILYARQPRPLLDVEKIDSASRGPLGSTKILWPTLKVSLLRIGAAVTVLALALDPFTQQLIQLEQHSNDTPDNGATITRTQRYSKGFRRMLYNNRNDPSVQVTTDFAMQSAVLDGLAQPYATNAKQVSFNCPSANCTWTSYQSLAVCSTCYDLQSQLIRYTDWGWMYRQLGKSILGNIAIIMDDNGTSFMLPNGLLINNDNGAPGKYGNVTVYLTAHGTANASETIKFKNSDRLIWAMTILRMPDVAAKVAKWPNATVEAKECALYYCVKQYDSTVENGVLQEAETEISAPRNTNSYQYIVEDGELYYGDYDGLEPDSWPTLASVTPTLNLAFDTKASAPWRTDLQFGNAYNLSQAAIDSISAYFQNQFRQSGLNATEYVNQIATKDLSRANLTKADVTVPNAWYIDGAYAPSTMQSLYFNADINATFQSLAKSMSNIIRADADNNTLQVGTTSKLQTRYLIQWPWIALHATLLLAGILFLTLTIYETKQSGAPAWKSHSLAPFLCCADIGDLFADIVEIDVMEHKAAQYFVQLYSNTTDHAESTGLNANVSVNGSTGMSRRSTARSGHVYDDEEVELQRR